VFFLFGILSVLFSTGISDTEKYKPRYFSRYRRTSSA